MYQTIFLRENEKDIFQALKNQGIKTKVFEYRLAELFNRVYNNYVGYYLFKQDDVVYKMIVLPKTIEPSDSAEKEFVDYLLHYYRIKNIHKLDKERNIPNSLLQLAFKSNNSIDSGHNFLEKFQSHRYRAILQDIEEFFKRHKNSKRIKQDYVSQSIKYTLNLKRNIKELDKTKIHQTQSKDVVFSMLATVTYNALKLFVAQKYSGLEKQHRDEVFKEVKRVQSILLKKYKIERGYKLSLATLQGIKLVKLFSKTEENRQLLVDIKSLFGFEQMYKDDTVSIDYRQDLTTTSLFINPSNFYEWYVYDILKKYADDNAKIIEFDKNNSETTTNYYLNKRIRAAMPDYILTDKVNKIKVVIDAKWKNVSKPSDIESGDYLKLKFDVSLWESKGYGVSSYLIYPNINIEENSYNIFVADKSVFNFNTIEIDMAFEKYDNSLEFDFDVLELQERIEVEEQKQTIKHSGAESSVAIEPIRDTLISELIQAENEERKEELGGLFDEALYIESQKLVQTLDKEIVLPQVQKILDEFQDIMEDESITFIKSTSTIYGYYKHEESVVFDFSMPGSGLWKLIEVELNTSFIWQLRITSQVCNNQEPWKKICKKNAKIDQELDNGRKVSLSMSDMKDKSKLQSVMLGGIKLLLDDTSTLNEFNSFFTRFNDDKEFINIKLLDIISKIIMFRNEHAHIKAMTKETFEALWDLLFIEDNDGKNIIQRLLMFKRNMKVYIDER